MAVKRGLVLAKYGDLAASTRQRIVQTIPYLQQAGIEIDVAPLLDNRYLENLFKKGQRNPLSMLWAYDKRLITLARAARYDFIWVQYELFPYLPGIFETIVNASGRPVICDYDDAIFHQYDQHRNPLIRTVLGKKLKPLLRRADLAFCGNRYLQDYVGQYCEHTELIPTTLDISIYTPAQNKPQKVKPTLGWIGSPSTWNYCKPYVEMLSDLVKADKLEVLVIGAGPAADKNLPFTFRDWVEAREIKDIQEMDIGIMPIPDEPWARGKCGYKLIQYMACGLPVVASPVGVNTEIVSHGENGFLVTAQTEWGDAIAQLVMGSALRQRMGADGRKKVEQHYSIQQYGPKIAALIQELCAQRAASA